nr:hypothetical protein [Micromonospora sp. DSM 115978]
MHKILLGEAHELLPLETYWADFNERFWQTTAPGFWKLERQQHFQEPNDESGRAFAAGRWDAAMRILDGQRGYFVDYYRRAAEQGFTPRRVRVAEKPICPYLQWELHVLRLRHECGGLTRVIGPDQVASFEAGAPLPEIYTLGLDLMYEAVYDDEGVLAAARRFTDRDLIARCQRLIEDLYQLGEPLDEFFTREVATLQPPPRT